MKSPVYREYENKMVAVSNQFCYFLFADSEVESHLSNSLNGIDDSAFVGDIFPKNLYSTRIHVKASTLPEYRRESFNTLAGVSLMASVEYLLSFVESIQDFRALVSVSYTHLTLPTILLV